MTTLAEKLAARLGNDGQNWHDDNGLHLEEIALMQMGASRTYSMREYDESDQLRYVDGFQGSYIAGDPIRYAFPDGSAVVESGGAWAIEGAERYSWAE